MTVSSYQMKIIISTADLLHTPAKPDQIGFKIVADYVIGEADKHGQRKTVRVAFEDDAAVYIYVGISTSEGFWSDGAEVTLSNMPEAVVLATLGAIAGN